MGNALMARTKTVAVDERVWQRLKELMKKEKAASLGDVIAGLVEKYAGVGPSRFGVYRKRGLKFTQREHEEITRDFHWRSNDER